MKQHFINGHLTDEALALYVEALKLGQLAQLPEGIQEHIQACDDCHREVMDLYSLIADADYSALGQHPSFEQKQPKRRNLYIRLTYGALALAASLCALLYFNTRENLNPSVPDTPIQAFEDSIQQEETITELPEQEVAQEQPEKREEIPQTEEQAPELLAANFDVSDNLEDLVGEFTRSDIIKINNPSPGAEFKPGQFISFAWQQERPQPHFLIIVNNQEEEIFKIFLENGEYQYNEALPEGLYYWKLESEDDLLYVGKFFVR